MGPWGSLVSSMLGVHDTPVQIWAGPPNSTGYLIFRGVFKLKTPVFFFHAHLFSSNNSSTADDLSTYWDIAAPMSSKSTPM